MRLKFRTSLAWLLETGVLNPSTSTSCSFSLMPLDTCLSSQHARGFTLSVPVTTCVLAHGHLQDIPVPTQSWLSSAARCHTGGQCQPASLLPRDMPWAPTSSQRVYQVFESECLRYFLLNSHFFRGCHSTKAILFSFRTYCFFSFESIVIVFCR